MHSLIEQAVFRYPDPRTGTDGPLHERRRVPILPGVRIDALDRRLGAALPLFSHAALVGNARAAGGLCGAFSGKHSEQDRPGTPAPEHGQPGGRRSCVPAAARSPRGVGPPIGANPAVAAGRISPQLRSTGRQRPDVDPRTEADHAERDTHQHEGADRRMLHALHTGTTGRHCPHLRGWLRLVGAYEDLARYTRGDGEGRGYGSTYVGDVVEDGGGRVEEGEERGERREERVENREWRMENREWRMENGEW